MKSLKKTFLIALLAFASSNVFSQDYTASLSINNDNIVNAVPGGSGTFDLVLTNTDPGINSITFELTLPKGVTLGKPSTYTKYDNVQKVSRSYDEDDDLYVIAIESIFDEDENEEVPLSVNSDGATIVSFTVDYDAKFSGGEGKMANIAIGGKEDHKDKSLVIPITFKVGAATETVTITLDHEYITYCSDKPLDFSDSELGLTPLVVTNVTATEAEVAGLDKVAAYEGIIINGTPGTYTIPVVTGSTPSKYSGNKLVGTTEEISIDAENYVLSDGKFVKCNAGTLPANKAYLKKDVIPPSAGAKGITIVFDGNTTGINEIQKAETDGAIYNLSGMRVSKIQKGVYIMNGRKVIVK